LASRASVNEKRGSRLEDIDSLALTDAAQPFAALNTRRVADQRQVAVDLTNRAALSYLYSA
jgi:hypothetical protein